MVKSMTKQEAQDIMSAFDDVLAEHADVIILDARVLPESKQRLYQAFDQEITRYEMMKNAGVGFDETLEQIKALRWRISDFQTIDPKDEAIVAQLNSGPNLRELEEQLAEGAIPEQEREDADLYLWRASQIQMKYHRRGMTEARGIRKF